MILYFMPGEGADEVVMEDKSGNLEKVLSDKYAEKGGDFNTRNLISASFSTNAGKHAVTFVKKLTFRLLLVYSIFSAKCVAAN